MSFPTKTFATPFPWALYSTTFAIYNIFLICIYALQIPSYYCCCCLLLQRSENVKSETQDENKKMKKQTQAKMQTQYNTSYRAALYVQRQSSQRYNRADGSSNTGKGSQPVSQHNQLAKPTCQTARRAASHIETSQLSARSRARGWVGVSWLWRR